MPNYFLYGLNISSDLDFGILPTSKSLPDIEIRLSDVPETIPNATFISKFFESDGKQILIRFREQVRYLVNTSHISYQILNDVDLLDFRQFILGPVFSAMLHLKSEIPLHASAVSIDNKGILFAGESGVGKSTMAASFINSGSQLLNDDISLINSDHHNKSYIIPSIPKIKLWNDSAIELGLSPNKMEDIAQNCEKKAWPIDNKYHTEPMELSKIFVIKKHIGKTLEIKTIKGLEKINILNEIIYRSYFTRGLNTSKIIFEKLIQIAKNSEIYVIQRPTQPFKNKEMSELIFNFI